MWKLMFTNYVIVFTRKNFIRKIQKKKKKKLYNIVITVVLQMGYTNTN